MSFLISINQKGTCVIHAECIKLMPELAYLTEKELLCIVLAYDYYSPMRQFANDEAERRARAHVYGTENANIFKQPKIVKAVELYKSLQYDEVREQIKAYRRRLDTITKIIDTIAEDDLKKLKDVIVVSKELRAEIRKLEEELNKEEEEDYNTEDESKLSLLERLQKNVARYKEITSKKIK